MSSCTLDGLQSVDSGLQSVDSGLQSVDSGLQSVNRGLQSVNSGLQFVDSVLQSVDSGLQSVDSGLQSVDSGLQSVDSGLQYFDRAHPNKGAMYEACYRPSDEQSFIVTFVTLLLLLVHITVVITAICYNVPYVSLCFLHAPRWLLPAPMVVQPCEYQQIHMNCACLHKCWSRYDLIASVLYTDSSCSWCVLIVTVSSCTSFIHIHIHSHSHIQCYSLYLFLNCFCCMQFNCCVPSLEN